MPRPKSRTELLQLSRHTFEKLNAYIDGLTTDKQEGEFPVGTLNRRVSDVLMHLHHWHGLVLGWCRTAATGDKPAMPAVGYSWQQTPALNQWIWETYQDISLNQARKQVYASYRDVRTVIEEHTEEELFTKKYYSWTGSTSLGAYLISATSSHYAWALKLIRKATK